MRVLHVCSEFFPLLKTGGLADVIGALPAELNEQGIDTRILIPAFPAVMRGISAVTETHLVRSVETFAGQVNVLYAQYQNVPVYLIEASHLFEREGSPYHDAHQHDYSDNVYRFAVLGFIASELAKGLDSHWQPNIVQAHDWHAGLSCAYLANEKRHGKCLDVKTVFTVHNLAFSGCFASHFLEEIWLPADFLHVDGLEFHGQLSFLKAGLYYADHVTTVSPTYADEICTVEFGCGFEGLLQTKRKNHALTGILNGVDDAVWHPQTDKHLVQNYTHKTLGKKTANKSALQKELGLTVAPQKMLYAVVSRLSWQKGLDLVLAASPYILEHDAQLVVLGSGDEGLQHAFLHLSQQHPTNIGVVIGYDEALAHRIVASADVLLMPSRFEPCGLTQLYGLKYGSLPLVRRTGGLADSVNDCSLENLADNSATGFVFERETLADLQRAIKRSLVLSADKTSWETVQKQAMAADFSWQRSAKEYLSLYSRLK